jgi:hypothetical protein
MVSINAETEDKAAWKRKKAADIVNGATIAMEFQIQQVRHAMRVLSDEGGRSHELAVLDALRELDALQARAMDCREWLKAVQ